MRWWLLVVIALWQSAWGALGIERIRFEQAVTDGPNIWVYLDARSRGDQVASTDQIGDLQMYIGGEEASVNSVTPFTDSGEGVGYIFLVDVSKSLPEQDYARIRRALSDWIDAMKRGDMAAIVTFGSSVKQRTGFITNRDKLKSYVSGLGPRDQNTLLYEGLKEATALGAQHRIDPTVPRRKLIVTLSDGDNDPKRTGMTLGEVEKAIASSRIPIHAIAFNAEPEGEKILAKLARLSGGSFLSSGSKRGIGGSYADLRLRINEAIVAHALCHNCPLNGKKYPLQIRLAGGASVPGELTVKMSPGHKKQQLPEPAPVVAPVNGSETPLQAKEHDLISDWRLWAGVGALVALLAAAVGFRAFRKGQKTVSDGIPLPIGLDDVEQLDSPATVGERSLLSGRVRFTVISGADRGEVFDIAIAGSATLGRSEDCDLSIPEDEEVSRQHAQVMIKNGKLVIADVRSSHGTYVNGVPVPGERVIEDGDIVRMGRTELHVSI